MQLKAGDVSRLLADPLTASTGFGGLEGARIFPDQLLHYHSSPAAGETAVFSQGYYAKR